MPRRKKTTPPPPNPDWVISTHWQANSGRWLVAGETEVKISGERGRFRFLRHVLNTKTGGEWIDVVGKDRQRSFRPDRIRTVHRMQKLRPTG